MNHSDTKKLDHFTYVTLYLLLSQFSIFQQNVRNFKTSSNEVETFRYIDSPPPHERHKKRKTKNENDFSRVDEKQLIK